MAGVHVKKLTTADRIARVFEVCPTHEVSLDDLLKLAYGGKAGPAYPLWVEAASRAVKQRLLRVSGYKHDRRYSK